MSSSVTENPACSNLCLALRLRSEIYFSLRSFHSDDLLIERVFLDEIVEMYEGVTQEEIAELLREQYGVEE